MKLQHESLGTQRNPKQHNELAKNSRLHASESEQPDAPGETRQTRTQWLKQHAKSQTWTLCLKQKCLSLCLSGVIALVLYYRFLHPKSFEIFNSIRHRGIGGACMERGSTLSLEEKVTPTFHRHATLSGLSTIICLSACLSVSLSQILWLSL